MTLEFIDFNFSFVVTMNCDIRKVTGKNGSQRVLENHNINNIEFRKKTMTINKAI